MRIQDIGRTLTTRRWALLLVAFAGLSSCRGGCRRESGGDQALTPQGRLAPFPAAARVVVSVEVGKLRNSPAAAKVQQLALESQADKATIAEFQRRTGFDPIKQISSLTVAFPRTRAAAATSASCSAPITSTRRAWSPTRATSCRRRAMTWCRPNAVA